MDVFSNALDQNIFPAPTASHVLETRHYLTLNIQLYLLSKPGYTDDFQILNQII